VAGRLVGGALVLACAGVPACLDPNADFDGPVTSGSEGTGSSSGGGSSSSTEGPTSCDADGFEPNDDQEASIQLGSYDVILETVDALDRYNIFFDDVGTGEFHMAADADVRVCAFVGCEGSFEPAVVDCTIGLEGSNEGGNIGCCGGPALGMTYVCAPELGAKLHLVVDQAPADCTLYTLELATTPL